MDDSPQSIIERLIRSGMSQSEIAAALTDDGTRITQPTINRIKKGAGTSFEIGSALQRLARKRLKPTERRGVALSA